MQRYVRRANHLTETYKLTLYIHFTPSRRELSFKSVTREHAHHSIKLEIKIALAGALNKRDLESDHTSKLCLLKYHFEILLAREYFTIEC